MDVKKKILFIVPSLIGGGAERIISIIFNFLNRKKFEPILVLLKNEGPYLEDIPKDIQIIDLQATQARYAIIKIIRTIKQVKPDIVFSTLGYLNILIAMIKPFLSKNIVFIARESNTVSVQNKQEKYPVLFDLLYKVFYNNFDQIISQSDYMKKDLIDNYNIMKDKIEVIHNPVNITKIETLANKSMTNFYKNDKFNLLTVGRLDYQKGYDLLIEAMSKLDKKFHLTILGEGKDDTKLEQLAKSFDIEDNITFAGFQSNPYIYMIHADLLILSSRYEGLPNVVLEANACGTPVVAFNCPGGTGEIIENGVNGFLCECGNIDELIKKINKAYLHNFDKNKIKRLIKNKYDANTIIKHYEKIFS